MLSWTEKPSPQPKGRLGKLARFKGLSKENEPVLALGQALGRGVNLANELIGIRRELPGWCVGALAQGSG